MQSEHAGLESFPPWWSVFDLSKAANAGRVQWSFWLMAVEVLYGANREESGLLEGMQFSLGFACNKLISKQGFTPCISLKDYWGQMLSQALKQSEEVEVHGCHKVLSETLL